MRRAFRPSAGTQSVAPLPQDDDLVVHFRDLRDCGGWRATGTGGTRSTYRTTAASQWFHGLDLYSPPVAFFNAAIAMHMARFQNARVWIVSQPCDRQHPTVRALQSRWSVHFLTAHDEAVTCTAAPSCKSAVLDFLWLQAARHLVLSPSTFGWWPAFLSINAATIHFPIFAAFSPWGANMWCHLVPEDDARYIFHDVWANATWHGRPAQAGPGREARRRCDVYVRACLQARICATDPVSASAARSALPPESIDAFKYTDNNFQYVPRSEQSDRTQRE
jgi:hypothetical protein